MKILPTPKPIIAQKPALRHITPTRLTTSTPSALTVFKRIPWKKPPFLGIAGLFILIASITAGFMLKKPPKDATGLIQPKLLGIKFPYIGYVKNNGKVYGRIPLQMGKVHPDGRATLLGIIPLGKGEANGDFSKRIFPLGVGGPDLSGKMDLNTGNVVATRLNIPVGKIAFSDQCTLTNAQKAAMGTWLTPSGS